MHLHQRRFGLPHDHQPRLASEFFNSLGRLTVCEIDRQPGKWRGTL